LSRSRPYFPSALISDSCRRSSVRRFYPI